jgi:hypothetical protein
MNMLLAALIFIPLLAVAISHLVWAAGGTWPIRSEELLAKTVVGRPGITRMPPRAASLLVAILVLAAGTAALALADPVGGGSVLTLIGLLLAAVFLVRGIVGYSARWRHAFPEEPFATLDRKTYSPLCLFIGSGFLLLVIMRLL